MTLKPVTRKGTMQLLKLKKAALNGDEEAAEELLKYISLLESNESILFERCLRFANEFNTVE